MSIVSLTNINDLILQMTLSEYRSNTSITPAIKNMKVVASPQNICSQDDVRFIRDKFFNYEYPIDRKITDEDTINRMCNFILGSNISNGEDGTIRYKDYISKYFSKSMKEELFKRYLDKVFPNSKCCYIDPNDYSNEMYYNPRVNGIPLKYLNGVNFEMKVDDIKNILLGIEVIKNDSEAIIIKHVLTDEKFFDGPWLTDKVCELKEKIITEEYTSIENNYLNNFDNNLINEVKNGSKNFTYEISDTFANEIISNIPEELSLLEKSIYVYSKLCRLLSYDPVFFIKEDESNVLNPNLMHTYDKNNNSVVCHNFAYILSTILKKLGIDNVKEKMTIHNEKFNGHSNISYLVDNMVILADSTRQSVLDGDIGIHKFTNELNGIRCEMYSVKQQQLFWKAKEKVMNIIKYEDLMVETILPSKDIIEGLDSKERYVLFNNYLENTNLNNIDFISYAKRLIQVLDLHIDTTIMYKKEDLKNVLLKVNIKGYSYDGSEEIIEYIIDSNSKCAYLGNEYNIFEKEILTTRK